MEVQNLSNRKVISVSGKDALSFLQGLVTNDMNNLSEGNVVYTLMLTPQGRFAYDFFVTKNGDSILVDHEASFTSEIKSKFNIYKLRSEVVIEDLSEKYNVLQYSSEQEGAYKDPRHSELGYRKYIEHEVKGDDSYDKKTYDLIIPEPHKDMIQGRSFPLEYGMDRFNAISFEKGCYMGQENTARTKYRGTVRKGLFGWVADEDISSIALGTEILHGDAKLGIFCSALGNKGKILLRTEDFEKINTKSLIIDGKKVAVI